MVQEPRSSFRRLVARIVGLLTGEPTEPFVHGQSPTPRAELSDRVKQLAPVNKIRAIQAHRQETRARLAEARSAVEAFLSSKTKPVERAYGRESRALVSDRVKQLAVTNKIAAIKAYREETSAGLAEAKDAVEAFLDRR